MYWNGIAQNLTIETSQLIYVYKGSDNIGTFHRSLMNLKKPDEANRTSKPSKIVDEKTPEIPIVVDSEIIPEEPVIPEPFEPGEVIDTSENEKHYKLYLREEIILRSEIERLQQEITSRDATIGKLEKALSDVQEEKEKFENGYYNYLIKLDKVREALESNVPVNLIIDRIENWDDE